MQAPREDKINALAPAAAASVRKDTRSENHPFEARALREER